ncbi:DUF1501 domain-containing protein [Candidatus Thiothrix anitrata]|uniref:DUF1501 domain-containing protein n=1 Tax=Candidatus Thiothrix anitrata TaxID=2823902 RepID=A0ABX7X2N5_9GAMM|nr:DUF1501 domain-containing protein [Candidatus Thiothrix anitrata]QTR49861.1 DUF1501 domain-containing protein [Candidatus Thiothrix anitrata]
MNRRAFLQWSAAAPLVGWLPQTALASSKQQRVLVLVKLSGGNDGFNTLIPHADPLYYSLRPTLAIPRHQVIDTGQGMGVNPYLKTLKPWWDAGQMAWVQGVGYPHGDLSHFRSNDIWETASTAPSAPEQGWLAQTLAARNGLHGIVMGEQLGPLLGKNCNALAMQSPAVFLSQVGLVEDIAPTNVTPALAHLTRTQHKLYAAGQQLESKLRKPAALGVPFSTSALGRDLESVAQMILSGVNASVYLVTQEGFDTHSNQVVAHSNLLHHLAGGLDSFARAMQRGGRWNDVVLMTYSEFGRRPQENRGKGTDHGTASAQLLLGGRVRGGIYGDAPALHELDANGNPQQTVDFRKVYGTLAQQWLGLQNPWGKFGTLPLV